MWALRGDSDAEGIGFRVSVEGVIGCLLVFGCLGGKGDVLAGVGFGFCCSGGEMGVVGDGVLGCASRRGSFCCRGVLPNPAVGECFALGPFCSGGDLSEWGCFDFCGPIVGVGDVCLSDWADGALISSSRSSSSSSVVVVAASDIALSFCTVPNRRALGCFVACGIAGGEVGFTVRSGTRAQMHH